MKIHQYQELYKLDKSELEPIEKAAHLYAIMKNLDFDYVSSKVPIKKYVQYYKKKMDIRFIKVPMFYNIGFKFYKINLGLSENSLNDNAMVLSYAANESEMIDNMHLILATLTKRRNQSLEYFNKLAENIRKKVDVSIAYSLCIFFLKILNYQEAMMKLNKNLEITNNELKKMLQEDI